MCENVYVFGPLQSEHKAVAVLSLVKDEWHVEPEIVIQFLPVRRGLVFKNEQSFLGCLRLGQIVCPQEAILTHSWSIMESTSNNRRVQGIWNMIGFDDSSV